MTDSLPTSPSRVFICEPYHGLGNRLLTIGSSCRLAKKSNATLAVLWRHDRNIDVPFHVLFGNEFTTVNSPPTGIDRYDFKMPPAPRAIFSDDNQQIVYFSGWTHAILAPTDLSVENLNQVSNEIANEIRLLFRYFLSSIKPHLSTVNFPDTLGIHIRRNTDVEREFAARLSINNFENSTQPHPELTNWNHLSHDRILDLCTGALKICGLKSVFISSSDHALKERLGRSLTQQGLEVKMSLYKYYGSDNQSIIEAMTDMLLLSRCGCILRSSKTTFSAVASLIGSRREIVFNDSLRLQPSVATILKGNAL